MTNTSTDDALLDEEWLAAPQKRSRARTTLIAVLAAAVCFLGGALAHKHYGAETTATAGPAGGGGFPGGAPNGFPAGAFPGTGQQGADQQGAAGSTPEASDATDSVIGRVVAINDDGWVVEDLGGKKHTVALADGTKIVREQRLTKNQVKTGDLVQVTGTTSNNQLQADDVTLR